MAARRHTSRLSLASAVAVVAVSLTSTLDPVAAAAPPHAPRISMGARMIRTIVSEHDGGSAPVSAPSVGAGEEEQGSIDDTKLIRLGDIDDNGAADYAYVSQSALHVFLFSTDGGVTSHRAVMLSSLAPDAAKEEPKQETPASQVRKVLNTSSKVVAEGAAEEGKKRGAPGAPKADAPSTADQADVKADTPAAAVKLETKETSDLPSIDRAALAAVEKETKGAKAGTDIKSASQAADIAAEKDVKESKEVADLISVSRATRAAAEKEAKEAAEQLSVGPAAPAVAEKEQPKAEVTEVANMLTVGRAASGMAEAAKALETNVNVAAPSMTDLQVVEAAVGHRKLSSLPDRERASLATDALVVRATSPTDGCLFTPTECECDLKAAITGSGTCFSHTRTENGVDICVSRDCAASYVCACGGSQKCARGTEDVLAWTATPTPRPPVPALRSGESYCTQRTTAQATTTLIGPMPTPAPTPPPAGCVLDGTQCTCALKSSVGGVDTCATHDGVDGSGNHVCSTRRCSDKYVCDCGGASLCEHHDVTNEFWSLGGAAGGDKFYCELASKTTTVSACLSNCA